MWGVWPEVEDAGAADGDKLGKVRRSTRDNWRNGIFLQVRPVSSDGENMKAARWKDGATSKHNHQSTSIKGTSQLEQMEKERLQQK